MVGGFSINMKRAWIIAQFVPSLQGIIRTDRGAIHGDSVSQQSQDCHPRQKAGSHCLVRLLIPPSLRDFVGRMALNQQRE